MLELPAQGHAAGKWREPGVETTLAHAHTPQAVCY